MEGRSVIAFNRFLQTIKNTKMSQIFFAMLLICSVVFSESIALSAPTTVWTARYNAPANLDDYATAVTADGNGNVYVTGWSNGGPGLDYATIKYNKNGQQLWAARYDGPQSSEDVATAIAVDINGNVYVTGRSFGSGPLGTICDFATIKYGPKGNQLWVARFSGTGNYAQAMALSVDGNGNVYVTGSAGYSDASGITNNDYATVKYDTNGNQLWAAQYNGPGNGEDIAQALSVDSSGNVIVTGFSVGSTALDLYNQVKHDYATIKYDTNGNQLWAARYNGPGDDDDQASALSVDGSGNVYVTGWSRSSTRADDYDYATIKYGANGSQLWVARYNGPGNSYDFSVAIFVDGKGYVYVTGTTADSGGLYGDYATIKYGANGSQLWVARYNGTGNGSDFASAIKVDGSGNVYVTGASDGVPGTSSPDYATIKYGANGSQLWVARYNGTGNWYDMPSYNSALFVDGSRNVYVTGNSYSSSGNYDYLTIKYK